MSKSRSDGYQFLGGAHIRMGVPVLSRLARSEVRYDSGLVRILAFRVSPRWNIRALSQSLER